MKITLVILAAFTIALTLADDASQQTQQVGYLGQFMRDTTTTGQPNQKTNSRAGNPI